MYVCVYMCVREVEAVAVLLKVVAVYVYVCVYVCVYMCVTEVEAVADVLEVVAGVCVCMYVCMYVCVCEKSKQLLLSWR